MHSFFKVITIFLGLSSVVIADDDNQKVRVEIATIIWNDTFTDEEFPLKRSYSLVDEAIKLTENKDFSKESKLFSILPKSYHTLLNEVDITRIKEAEFVEHLSWIQKLTTSDDSKYVLVSEDRNQCVVKVFKSRHPRVKTKCSMGPNSLQETSFLIYLDDSFKDLKSEDSNLSRQNNAVNKHFLLEAEKRINFNEFYYFDHPKIGIILGIFLI
tara:strand:- start:1756 stop:2394 length:639 start_codon:yes stop_codon:yes gene_type:complete